MRPSDCVRVLEVVAAAGEPVNSATIAEQLAEDATPRQVRRWCQGAREAGLVRAEGRRGYVLTAGGVAGLRAWRGRR